MGLEKAKYNEGEYLAVGGEESQSWMDDFMVLNLGFWVVVHNVVK